MSSLLAYGTKKYKFIHIVAIICMHLFLSLDVAFNNIAGLKVLKVDEADTTLITLRNRVNLRLEAAQRPDSALCQDLVSSHNTNVAALLNDEDESRRFEGLSELHRDIWAQMDADLSWDVHAAGGVNVHITV